MLYHCAPTAAQPFCSALLIASFNSKKRVLNNNQESLLMIFASLCKLRQKFIKIHPKQNPGSKHEDKRIGEYRHQHCSAE